MSKRPPPPAPAADDTYPAPDSNHPFADPRFPFANPPYASRAYSYVTVAQSPADVVNERAPAPPSTAAALMQRELAEVKDAVDKLTRDQLAIVYKWADGASTPTPPGHWNFIACPTSWRRSGARFARPARWRCWTWRCTTRRSCAGTRSSRITTRAQVLSYLLPGGASYFDAQMEEAAISRLYAGIHYRSDIEVGKQVGRRVGGYAVSFARIDGADREATSSRELRRAAAGRS